MRSSRNSAQPSPSVDATRKDVLTRRRDDHVAGLVRMFLPTTVLDIGGGGSSTPTVLDYGSYVSVTALGAVEEDGGGSTGIADSMRRFPDASFDVVAAVDVLEHTADPDSVLKQIRRICSGYLVASVAREPHSSAVNLARGRHVHRLGRPATRIHAWSARDFRKFVTAHGRLVRVNYRLPWTITVIRLDPFV